jgi:hypothetical protein
MRCTRPLVLSALALALGAASALPQRAAPLDAADPWALGARVALQAYSRASDAYTANVACSVALWTVLIAALVVLLEWLLGRGRPPHGG